MVEKNKLQQEVLSEQELMQVLGLTKKQLDHLRWTRDFPVVSLSRTNRVYLVDDVLNHIRRMGMEQRFKQPKIKKNTPKKAPERKDSTPIDNGEL